MSEVKIVGSGVDTLILNVRYSDRKGQPVKQELDEKLQADLDYLQGEARRVETAVATDWMFQNVLLFVEPHGAGKQWRWLLTSRLLNVVVSRGKFNDVIAQVRFSSEYLWSQEWCGDALTRVHTFLMSIFGEDIHLQLSEVHLCQVRRGFMIFGARTDGMRPLTCGGWSSVLSENFCTRWALSGPMMCSTK